MKLKDSILRASSLIPSLPLQALTNGSTQPRRCCHAQANGLSVSGGNTLGTLDAHFLPPFLRDNVCYGSFSWLFLVGNQLRS